MEQGDAACEALIEPRVVLLQALRENFFRLPFVLLTPQWSTLFQALYHIMEDVWSKLSLLCASSADKLTLIARMLEVEGRPLEHEEDIALLMQQDLDELMKDSLGTHAAHLAAFFSGVVDMRLLSYLQQEEQAALAELVKQYMPRVEQSWQSFLESSEDSMAAFKLKVTRRRDQWYAIHNVHMGLSIVKELVSRLASQVVPLPCIVPPGTQRSNKRQRVEPSTPIAHKASCAKEAASKSSLEGVRRTSNMILKAPSRVSPRRGDVQVTSSIGLLSQILPKGYEKTRHYEENNVFYATPIGQPCKILPKGYEKTGHYEEHKVFYATDRRVTINCEYENKRTIRRLSYPGSLDTLQYGVVTVGIPICKHPKGAGGIEKPEHMEEADPFCHVVILAVDATMQSSYNRFMEQLNLEVNPTASVVGLRNDQKEKDVLIYIHGYNTNFKDAMKRAGQLWYDLHLSGAIISYSWSSASSIYYYTTDEHYVQETVACLANFIKMCITKVKCSRVHLLAHSMGNRALIGALKELYSQKTDVDWIGRGLDWPLRNVILAAADEDPKNFVELVELAMKNYKGLKEYNERHKPHFSLYCSSCAGDWPIFISGIIHWRYRLGDRMAFLQSTWKANPECVDVIDATKISTGHSFYGDSSLVLKDLHHLLVDSSQASARSKAYKLIKRVDEKKTGEGKHWYIFGTP